MKETHLRALRIISLIMITTLLIPVIVVTAKPKEIRFTYVTTQSTATLDPAKHRDETESLMVMNLYDPLVYPQPGKPPKPWVAKRWEVSPDGMTWTFYIRKGIKFHDGTELTAEDVAFSMDRMLRMGKGFSWLWKGVLEPGDTEVLDKYTVRFHLRKPYGPFLATLVQLFIVNKDLIMANLKPGPYGEFGDYGEEFLSKHDAGSGPYYIEIYEPGTRYVFRKFEDYWGGWEENQIDVATVLVVGEEATEVTMLRKGEADMIEQWVSAETFEELKKEPGIVVQEDPAPQLFFVSLHNQKPPTDDVYFRKAISYAIDYEAINKVVFKGAVQAVGPVPVLMPGHNPNVTVYKRDLEKAREYLSKSKYADRIEEFTLEYMYVEYVESERRIGLIIQSNLAELGIKVKLRPETWARMVELVAKPETTPHMVAIFHTAKYPSPDSHTYLMFSSKAAGTYMSCAWYSNPVVDELLEKARATIDVSERYRLYGEVQKIVTEDAAILFIANPIHRIAYRDWVKGYKYIGILGYDLVWYNLRIEKEVSNPLTTKTPLLVPVTQEYEI